MNDRSSPLTVVDDPSVKELYANKVVSAGFDGGGITITLGVRRVLPEKIESSGKAKSDAKVYVTARLTLSPSSAVELAGSLAKVIEALRSNAAGQSPSKAQN